MFNSVRPGGAYQVKENLAIIGLTNQIWLLKSSQKDIFFLKIFGKWTNTISLNTGLILGLPPANERRRYKVTLSLIGWAQT